ncbi:MAG: 16S rRNA (cytidine(1402)-2'-O)-methyltransferase [Spirochaetales bacterium]|nr:16S rRNA (cytidine(1402)-2'-O)-methyltransferase [Spirochaetales bacterium]
MPLYIVATPIGNLADITLRALETLRNVDVVAAEDTRQTLKLLNAHGIVKRLISCRSANEAQSAQGILKLLDEGRSVAYCTDAGTPGLSDPGSVLVKTIRDAGHQVIPLPGASALATLLSVAGFGGRSLTFDGFMSPKPGRRRRRLTELVERGEAFMVYESPFRILKLLTDLSEIAPDRPLIVGREMTKAHEEFLSGLPASVLQTLAERPIVKGEFAVLVSSVQSIEDFDEHE